MPANRGHNLSARRQEEYPARVLLDTRVVILLATEGLAKLSPFARAILANPNTERLVSALSIQEIAQKTNTGRLATTQQDIDTALENLAVTLIPFNPLDAQLLFDLPVWNDHRDTIDRMLICTALGRTRRRTAEWEYTTFFAPIVGFEVREQLHENLDLRNAGWFEKSGRLVGMERVVHG